MNSIRFATEKDMDELKKIWKICFGDSELFIDYYFQEEFRADRVLLLEDQEIASMLTMIPMQISVPNDKKYSGTMLYAVATHPKFQGKGFSTQLMDYAKCYLKEQGIDVITLVPASSSLINFYGKRGYNTVFYHREIIFSHTEIHDYSALTEYALTIQVASPSDYQEVREKYLSNYLYQSCDINGIAYQKKLSLLSSCDIYLIRSHQTLIGCAIVEKVDDNELFVKELLVPEEYIMPTMQCVSNVFPSHLYRLRLPLNMGEGIGGSIKTFGMCQLLQPNLSLDFKGKPGYLGIAYD